jgi:hypothetical protein
MNFVTLGVVLGLFANVVCLLLIALLFKAKFTDKPEYVHRTQPPFAAKATREWVNPQSARSVLYNSSLHSMSPKNVKRICIGRGPCGGKTTAMTGVTERVRELGQKVYVVPETATLLMKGGAMINMEDFTRAQKVRFQAKILKLQLVLEDVSTDLCYSAVDSGEHALVLCDRGVMDGSAYISHDLWQALLDENGYSVVHLRDRRYAAVIHMVTSASGAEESYSGATNEARYEGMTQAREIDDFIQNAWTGHPSFTIVDNSHASFDAKLLKSVEQVCQNSGLPLQSYFKFLVVGSPELPASLHYQTLLIEEAFLLSKDNLIERISRRGQEGSYPYSYSAMLKDTRKTVVRS